jgi:arylsulfatase A-like enzyme
VVVALFAGAAAARAAARPNVLVIVTDDQRGGLSVMPFTRKWFGLAGVSYPRAFANTPLCCPARATIMTGRYTHNHGVLNNRVGGNLDQNTTIQKALRDAGYRTAIVGKFLNRWDLSVPPPNFDRWSLVSNVLSGEVFTNDYYYGGLWNVNGALRNVPTYSTRFIGSRAVSFLRAQEADDATPWYLYVAPPAPHLPATPESAYAYAPVDFWPGNPATEERNLSDKPPWWQTRAISESRGRRLRTREYRALMSVDDMVERISNALANLGEGRSTLVFFISDNGYAWGEHGRKGKTLPYPASVKVPMFLRWPRHVPAGTVDRRLVGHVDVTPTIRAAVGLPDDRAHPLDGRSLLDRTWQRDRILLEYFRTPESSTPPWASTWTSEYQYTEYYDRTTGALAFRELYDLIGDPWQLNNLYADASSANDPSDEVSAALSATLAQDRACVGVSCP